MTAVPPPLSWETACAGQHRLLRAIGRLAMLGDRDLDGSSLDYLEAAVTRLEMPPWPADADVAAGAGLMWEPSPLNCLTKPPLGANTEDIAMLAMPSLETYVPPMPDVPLVPEPPRKPWCQEAALRSVPVRPPQPPVPRLPLEQLFSSFASDSTDFGSGTEESSVDPLTPRFDVDVTVPDDRAEERVLTVAYEGYHYEVPVPEGCSAGSTFRAVLMSPR